MGKIMSKTKYTTLAVITAIFVLSLNTPSAHAGVLDWITGGQDATNSAIVTAISYMGTDNTQQANTPSDSQKDITIDVTPKKDTITAIKTTGKYSVNVTGYSSTPDQTDATPFITASNTHVRDGIIAANFLTFGTKVQLPAIFGDKIFTVEDRMNARYNHDNSGIYHIDIWFADRNQAISFGLKHSVKLVILVLK